MTRINAGIPVETLTDKHLLAEHREIKRIPNLIKKGLLSNIDQPSKFTLGKGHVKFFYDKQLFLYKRYLQIHLECLKRNFNVSDYSNAWDDIPSELNNDYTPTEEAIFLLKERIKERLSKSNL